MVKKRGCDNIYERESNRKMRRKSSSHVTPQAANCSKEVKNSLSDGLLNLYKKEADKLKNSSYVGSETEVFESNNSSAEYSSEETKMVNRSTKLEKKNYRDTVNDSPMKQHRAENKDNKSSSRVEFDGAETPAKTPAKKVKKTFSKNLTVKQSSVTFRDCGGIDNMLKDLFKMFMRLKAPEFYRDLNISPVRGLLLHGPPGSGKTHLARAIAGHFSLPLIEVVATELVCGISGESESQIRDTFDLAMNTGPCILFIDEIDAITPKRETASGGMERRMVTQLVKCMDDLNDKDTSFNVMVIGATNIPDAIDPSLRGGNRFRCELAIGIPNEQAKIQMLQVLCKDVKLTADFDFTWVAHHTAGYVAADLRNLVSNAIEIGACRASDKISTSTSNSCDPTLSALEKAESWFNSLDSSKEVMSDFRFDLCDFKEALKEYVPNFKREGFASVPNVTWEDVGALEHVKEELQNTMWPVKYNKFYEENNLSSTKGILLYGPKGCGKTLLAKALANECNINFLCVNGPELLNMYFGESEKSVRRCFERARNSAPCVIFFDEFDAFCPSRSASSSNAAAERVVNQLLTEMDGIQERKQVFVIAATNRKEKIDSAMLRPGRLEKQIYIGLPSPNGRVDILKSLTKNKTCPKIADNLDLETIALDKRCDGFSGADLAFLVREATQKAVKQVISEFEEKKQVNLLNTKITVNWDHFDEVLDEKKIKPSINKNERKYFERSQEMEASE